MKPWSISTTVRNPSRLRDFLKVLKELEGKPFDNENQMLFQILLIKNRLYKPTYIANKYRDIFENIEEDIPLDISVEVFNNQNYSDPPMRGRQSVNPLNKLGFCIARQSMGPIKITELGNLFLKGDYDISYVFLKSMLKLQFPNKWSSDFTQNHGFNISPFVASMHFINKANLKFGNKGLTQNEFSIFIPTLINIDLINDYLNKLTEYRESKNKNLFISHFAKWFYDCSNPTEKQIKNFFEYGDNIMRYFRMTKYFKVETNTFGADWRINLEPLRKIEIDYLLNNFTGKSLSFENDKSYYDYIYNIKSPELPIDKEQDLKSIIEPIKNNIGILINENNIILSESQSNLLSIEFDNLVFIEKQKHIENLRLLLIELKEKIENEILKYDVNSIKNIKDILKETRILRKISPEKFEKLIADSLKILNDEIKISPNYPMDDNGEPISHASGNQADIECFYKSFNKICEVTLDQSNKQWVRETQPVMRHLRDFEKKYENKNSYCLFIAPKIHIDTAYHFWLSIKHGYDGTKQRIIPITTTQFSALLDLLLVLISKGKKIKHTDIQVFYESVIKSAIACEGHTNWLNSIENTLNNWKGTILHAS